MMTPLRADSDQGRAELARQWANALRTTAYVPTSRHEIESLSCTVEVLGRGLPAAPELRRVDGLADKVTSLLGAVAAGYVAMLRARTLDQQEKVKQDANLAVSVLHESDGKTR